MKILFEKDKNAWAIGYINLEKTHQKQDYYKYSHQLNLLCFVVLW